MKMNKIIGLILLLSGCANLFAQSSGNMALIKGGSYIPLYGNDTSKITVEDFLIDKYPVTNAEFLNFVKENPTWKRTQVKRLFAEESYLKDWKSDTEIGQASYPDAPVTFVSWFAAKNYCQSIGKRLPTIDEWEYVAMADEFVADARKDSTFHQQILGWYEKPTKQTIPKIGNTETNYWGVYDMHGLVWEWVLDFNTVLISGESRKDESLDRQYYCAGSALGATDLMNYAAFMRYAFRGSLEADYAIKNLGFRCANGVENEN